MNGKRYVRRSSAIAARVLGDETMVMSATNSTLFTLDEIGTIIWEAADGTTSLDEIVTRKICSRYDISREVAMNDAANFVDQLAEHGLLQLSDQPIAQMSPLATVNSWAR